MATLIRVDQAYEIPDQLPVVALRDLVFFPYMVLPLLIGRPPSLAALIATPFQTAYGASKAAVRHLTMTVAAYGARDNIRCNAIHPGQMRTRMIEDIYAGTAARLGIAASEAERDFTAMIPMGRLGTAEDIGWAAVYLASDETRYMTGASLVVDGGSHIV